eukprot:TRINITY_DN1400_c0_g3_i1.p1 TRINITY_DN1400_c0_g3~~TRINITY_DN1400_c0_g3_i1.p1  ORF type:complete len:440 (+),score=46.77 TRINITY_DN1400_c0_g3_i1:310-1629(+)
MGSYLRKRFLCDVIVLSFFSFAGVLTRVGFSNLFNVTHGKSNIAGAVNTDFYSNVVGSFIMGLLVPFRKFIEKDTRWWGTTLYIGLTTGYCGSLTTFSSLSNQESTTVFGGSGTNFVMMILIGFSVSYWALQTAMHFSDSIANRISNKELERSVELPLISSSPPQNANPPPLSVSSQPSSVLLNKKNSNDESPNRSGKNPHTTQPDELPVIFPVMKVSSHEVEVDVAPDSTTVPSPPTTEGSITNSPTGEPHVDPEQVEEDEAPLPTQPDPHPHPHPHPQSVEGVKKPPPPIPTFMIIFLSLSIFLVYCALIILSILSSGAQYYTLICIFAPVGTLIRWSLGRRNIYHPKFPVYTFLVNIFGSAILSALHVISVHKTLSTTSSNVLAGLMTGFCGCLTTVSSFVNEVYHLHLYNSYVYALVSIFGTQIVLVLINGLKEI